MLCCGHNRVVRNSAVHNNAVPNRAVPNRAVHDSIVHNWTIVYFWGCSNFAQYKYVCIARASQYLAFILL